MTVFPTLTDQDLINLGIKPLGARRRILMAVHDYSVRKRISPSSSRFSGSAAPGAERRTSNGHWLPFASMDFRTNNKTNDLIKKLNYKPDRQCARIHQRELIQASQLIAFSDAFPS
jgi:hypothetical protein